MFALAITGEPGVGKTTLLMKVVEFLKSKGINIYGFYCPLAVLNLGLSSFVGGCG
jgi:nucleoside-triphosphatase THEP1